MQFFFIITSTSTAVARVSSTPACLLHYYLHSAKLSTFCNEPSVHLLKYEPPNRHYDVPLYKLHKVCKVFQLHGSQKRLDMGQR